MIAPTVDLAEASARAAPPTGAQPRPWGFWATLGWGMLAAGALLAAAVAYAAIWALTHQLEMPDLDNAFHGELVGIVAWIPAVAVLAVAIAIRKAPQREYFGLRGFSPRDLLLGIACLAGLTAVTGVLFTLLGIDDGVKSMEQDYAAAKLAGALPLMWISTVIVAPVTEELMFRGFLHRGWASSRFGVLGTIVLTSGLWAAPHLQYTWAVILSIFVGGLLLGWLRQRTGSTTLTIGLHALNNLTGLSCVAVKLEWFS